jgi:hypothetical protein
VTTSCEAALISASRTKDYGQILHAEAAENLLQTRTCERRDAGVRRETASEGRVRRRSRTCGMLYTPPGEAVSRAVERFAEAAGFRPVSRKDLTK